MSSSTDRIFVFLLLLIFTPFHKITTSEATSPLFIQKKKKQVNKYSPEKRGHPKIGIFFILSLDFGVNMESKITPEGAAQNKGRARCKTPCDPDDAGGKPYSWQGRIAF